jgi:phosphinothricin acetyltransferase
MHVLIAGIALPNPGSVALHEKFGMQQVGCFPEVGFKMDQWVDVGYWQVVLDD